MRLKFGNALIEHTRTFQQLNKSTIKQLFDSTNKRLSHMQT